MGHRVTQRYKQENFNNIKIGMSKSEVRSMLGDPFDVGDFGDICWFYSRVTRSNPANFFSRLFFLSSTYKRVVVCFNKKGNVTGAFMNILSS